MKRRIKGGEIAVDERNGVVYARGVSYGRAGRFDAAVPAPAWSTVLDATRPGPACPQRPGRLDFVTGPTLSGLEFDEDCLVLSVTAPADADALPVMVRFHGGAYVAGSGESPKYDPTPLVREGNVVVVNVSYRLGIFGYLSPPGAVTTTSVYAIKSWRCDGSSRTSKPSAETRRTSRLSVSPRARTRSWH